MFKPDAIQKGTKGGDVDQSDKGLKQSCQVLDVSANGARVETESPVGKTGVTLTLSMKLQVHEIAREVALHCEIKSLTQNDRSGHFFAEL